MKKTSVLSLKDLIKKTVADDFNVEQTLIKKTLQSHKYNPLPASQI